MAESETTIIHMRGPVQGHNTVADDSISIVLLTGLW